MFYIKLQLSYFVIIVYHRILIKKKLSEKLYPKEEDTMVR